MKGGAVYIPGAINQFLKLTGSLVSSPQLVARLVGNRGDTAYRKSIAAKS